MSNDPKRPSGPQDAMKFADSADAQLSTEVVPPRFPCAKCKGESKESGIKGWRVCCGTEFHVGLTEIEHLALLDDVAGHKARVATFEVMYKAADKELSEALRVLRERGWEPPPTS